MSDTDQAKQLLARSLQTLYRWDLEQRVYHDFSVDGYGLISDVEIFLGVTADESLARQAARAAQAERDRHVCSEAEGVPV